MGRSSYEKLTDELPTNCLSVFDNFVGLALKGLSFFTTLTCFSESLALDILRYFPQKLYFECSNHAAIKFYLNIWNGFSVIKVDESQCVALFMVSGSIKKFSQLIVSIFIFSQYFFQYILSCKEVWCYVRC